MPYYYYSYEDELSARPSQRYDSRNYSYGSMVSPRRADAARQTMYDYNERQGNSRGFSRFFEYASASHRGSIREYREVYTEAPRRPRDSSPDRRRGRDEAEAAERRRARRADIRRAEDEADEREYQQRLRKRNEEKKQREEADFARWKEETDPKWGRERKDEVKEKSMWDSRREDSRTKDLRKERSQW